MSARCQRDVCLRKRHLDQQATAAGAGSRRGAVSVGDGPDNRQPQALTLAVAGAVRAQPLERLRTAGRRLPAGPPARCWPPTGRRGHRPSGADLDPAARHVVPQCVVDQVGDQPLGQSRAARRRGRGRARCQRQPPALASPAAVRPAPGAASAARSTGSRWSRPAWPRASVSSASAAPAASPDTRTRSCAARSVSAVAPASGQRHLLRPLPRERGAQLVGGAGDEVALGGERGLQPGQQPVEGVGELAELVVAARSGPAARAGWWRRSPARWR